MDVLARESRATRAQVRLERVARHDQRVPLRLVMTPHSASVVA
jgi:hypothetical protein